MPAPLEMLALRCEQAQEPSWELDCQILEALGYQVKRDHARMGRAVRGYGPLRHVGGTHWSSFDRYTKSIDAARKLVPEGFEGSLYWGVEGFSSEAQLETQAMRDKRGSEFLPCSGTAKTLALALCAAALRARGASQ